jgi:anaerobic magnesium-protoporphyrin IX monomethyl ester cyclase
MKIKLVDPRGTRKGLNTGLGYLAGSLIAGGHAVEIIDFNNYSARQEERLKGLRDADIIGISMTTFTAEEALKLAEVVKARINPHALLVCGGVHITIDGPGFMKNNGVFDVAIAGDGERGMVEIASGRSPGDVDGAIYRNKGSIELTPPVPNRNLDSLPFPDYSCFDSVSRYNTSRIRERYPIVTSRGCPSNCLYCSVPLLSGRRWRARSPENMIAELKHMKKKHGSKTFFVLDDNFTVDRPRVKEFCRRLIEENLSLQWAAVGMKSKFTDREMARLMRASGATHVFIGIESAVPEVHRGIGKGETLDDVHRAIRNFRQAGIKVGGCFLIGLPGSNRELDRRSVELSSRMGLCKAVFSILVPYPGTRLYEMVKNDQNYKLLVDWRKGLHCWGDVTVVFESRDYCAKARKDTFVYASLRTKTYSSLVDGQDSDLTKASTLLKTICAYDLKHLPQHIYHLLAGYYRLKLQNRSRAKE